MKFNYIQFAKLDTVLDYFGISQSPESEEPVLASATITTADTTVASGERRPSWRLKVDNGSKVPCMFMFACVATDCLCFAPVFCDEHFVIRMFCVWIYLCCVIIRLSFSKIVPTQGSKTRKDLIFVQNMIMLFHFTIILSWES